MGFLPRLQTVPLTHPKPLCVSSHSFRREIDDGYLFFPGIYSSLKDPLSMGGGVCSTPLGGGVCSTSFSLGGGMCSTPLSSGLLQSHVSSLSLPSVNAVSNSQVNRKLSKSLCDDIYVSVELVLFCLKTKQHLWPFNWLAVNL